MLKLVNVSKYYSSNNVIALGLRKVNLELQSNEFVAIVGESGSGKTTLLNVICGIDTYEEGEIYLNGEETSYFTTAELENYRKKYVAFVFQNYNLIDSYTVLQNVEAPLVLAGYPKQQIRPRALEIIRRVGLEKHIHHKATRLSGGQKQRVVIARALAKNAPIIAADEPTGNLDSESAKQIIALLHEISREKLVIVVTHDYDQVAAYATRKIRIFDGEIVEDLEVRPTMKSDLPTVADAEVRVSFANQLAIAFRNLLAVPKKSLLMIAIFAVFSFFVALAYGAFNASLRDFENFGNQYFINTSITRIVVRKADKSILSTDDLNELGAAFGVALVLPADYGLDRTMTFVTTAMNEYGYYDSLYNLAPAPQALLKEDMLIAGRLPTAANEVVLATGELYASAYVEQYLDQQIALGDPSRWGEPTGARYTVVGIAATESTHLSANYVSDFIFVPDALYQDHARGTLLAAGYAAGSFVGTSNLSTPLAIGDLFTGMGITLDETVPDDTIQLPYYGTCDDEEEICAGTGSVTITDFYQTRTTSGIHIVYEDSTDNYSYVVAMNRDTYDALFDTAVYQVSVFAASDVGVDGLVRRIGSMRSGLSTLKYKVFYPYDSQASDEYVEFFIMLNIAGAAITFAFTLFAATLITYIIFRAIINTKMHDYAIFRTIGAGQGMIKTFIHLENVITAVIAYLIVLGSMLVMTGRVPFLASILKFYDLPAYLVLLAILVVMAVLISGKYCRRVFRESVHRTLKTE